MKIVIKLYYLILITNIAVLPIIFLFTAYKQYCYITGNYTEKMMRVEKCISGSNSKRISTSIEGKIKHQKVSFGLYDNHSYDFMSYLNKDKEEIALNYDDLKPLELDVRVAQFGTSDNVLFIKKEETREEATKRNLTPWIVIEIFSFGALLILYILKKKLSYCEISELKIGS
jgi:abortive infection bacteriophage resistance protein